MKKTPIALVVDLEVYRLRKEQERENTLRDKVRKALLERAKKLDW